MHDAAVESDKTAKDPYDEFEERVGRIRIFLVRKWHEFLAALQGLTFHERLGHAIAFATLLVLVCYTGYTMKIFYAASTQNELIREQIVGSQAAIIPLNEFAQFSFSVPIGSVDFNLRNTGHIRATDVKIAFTVRAVALPELTPIGTPWKAEIREPTLPITDTSNPPTIRRVEFPLTEERLTNITVNKTETMEVSGILSYNDGFGTEKPIPFCFRHLGGRGMTPCESWNMAVQGMWQSH